MEKLPKIILIRAVTSFLGTDMLARDVFDDESIAMWEAEADYISLRLMARAMYNPQAVLDREAARLEGYNKRKEAVGSVIHPPSTARIQVSIFFQ